jgi:hypothetical protein
MKKINNRLLLVNIAISALLLSCSRYEEQAPFSDGLYFKYYGNGRPYLTFSVETLDDKNYKVTRDDAFKKSKVGITEMYVDSNGIVYKSSKNRFEDKFSPIWIPVNEIKIGDEIYNGDIATRKDRWKSWEVLVIKKIDSNTERYFDINTGYWVGLFGTGARGAVTIELVETNVDIPTVE